VTFIATRFRQLRLRLVKESGQTLVEYSLILTLIGMVGLMGIILLAGGVDNLYDVVSSAADAMANSLS
jgi:Flp pilus assembly pilin Flp